MRKEPQVIVIILRSHLTKVPSLSEIRQVSDKSFLIRKLQNSSILCSSDSLAGLLAPEGRVGAPSPTAQFFSHPTGFLGVKINFAVMLIGKEVRPHKAGQGVSAR